MKSQPNCEHHGEKVHPVVEGDSLYYACDFCGEKIITWKRRFLNVWARYQRWRGEGYSFTMFVKEIATNMIQGGILLTTFKVMWDITLPWHWLLAVFLFWEVFNLSLGWWLIYRLGLPEAMNDYNARLQKLSPVSRESLDRLERIDKWVAEQREKEGFKKRMDEFHK